MARIGYYKGLIVSDTYAANMKYDEKMKKYIAMGYKYAEVTRYFAESGIEVKDEVINPLPLPQINDKIKLHPYQRKALNSWLISKRGIIVMPTGSGKTLLGLKTISILKVPTIIVVPTIDLLDQWHASIIKNLGVNAGILGGGSEDIQGITVSTYDSAYSRLEVIGNRFMYIIFDEVHHLPSQGYMEIAQLMPAPYRLGLTATPEREDGRDRLLPNLVGPIVYRISPADLSGKYLAEYKIKRIYVSLKEDEEKKYKALRAKMNENLKKIGIGLNSLQDFKRLIYLASKNRAAREALHAWYESSAIAINSQSKIEKLKELIERFKEEKVIIFTRDTHAVYKISKLFLIPAVTYKTPKDERREIIEKFRKGKYRVIVASNVFDEGVDIPDASVAIIVGGYGTRRQFIQRLGRILRMKDGKKAELIELVTRNTSDYRLSQRRRSNVIL
ncbi:MAG: DEAD/DEAH box helicase family protein [Caldisphaeraceae archaeon]|nr:DEAD/DEAH box helicase family protein [Caldisphaeraceae archaeon]